MYKPLADEIRPKSLDDVVGQQHILGPNGMLRRIVESGKIPASEIADVERMVRDISYNNAREYFNF